MKEKLDSDYLDSLDDLDFGGNSEEDTSEKIEYVERIYGQSLKR